MLVRTQLMLDKKIKSDLAKASSLHKKSISKMARKYLEESLANDTKLKATKSKNAREILLTMASHAEKGPGDSEYDKYAYGL